MTDFLLFKIFSQKNKRILLISSSFMLPTSFCTFLPKRRNFNRFRYNQDDKFILCADVFPSQGRRVVAAALRR